MVEAMARQRLRRDWMEVLRSPSDLVAAAPLPDNLFEWHANLRPSTGPLAGITFHVRIDFPSDYPSSPPMLHFPRNEIPSFRHPNLYSFGLCLDILSSYVGFRVDRAGWSPAYSVHTILMQLQSFLFEFGRIPQDHGGFYDVAALYTAGRVHRVRLEASKFVCHTCGHCCDSPHPTLPTSRASTVEDVGSASAASYFGLAVLQKRLNSTDKELADLRSKAAQHSFKVRCDRTVNGAASYQSGNIVAHLSGKATSLTLRIVDVKKNGGLRFGLARPGCTGLTEGTEQHGCVAWDSVGKLVLGKVVYDKSMPRMSIGDRVSVFVNQQGVLSFEMNGFVGTHNASSIWPNRPLEFFLFGSATPSNTDLGALRAMLSFRNMTVEIVDGPTLIDELAVATAKKTTQVEHRLKDERQAVSKVQSYLAGQCARICALRAEGRLNSRWANSMPKEVLLSAFLGIDPEDVPALMRVCSGWRSIVVGRGLLERLQVRCFFSKASPSQDVLGLGVKAEYHGDGNLKALSTELDTLSLTAFSEFKLRRGVWGDNFDFFLPLVLDHAHADRALPLLEQSLARLVVGRADAVVAFEPWMALAVLPQLMNSFAVSLMSSKAEVNRHASEKALLGYCSFHHMLLALSARHPLIARVANEKLRNFLRGENGRHKSETPDLGQLLIYCAVVKDGLGWEDISRAVVHEAGVRGVLWLLRENPRLEYSKASDTVFVRECFEGRLTSLRLLMFQAFFLRSVACPDGIAPHEALYRYNLQFGLPTPSQKEKLFQAARDILAVGSWQGFYSFLNLPTPTVQQQAAVSRQAMEESAACGYHTPSRKVHQCGRQRGMTESVLQHRRQRLPNATEKVGVKQDLKKAFANAAQKEERKSSIAHGSAVAAVENATSARWTAPAKQTLHLRNQFAAVQSDSESD